MPWFIYNSIKNYSAWEENISIFVPFCKLVNWCFPELCFLDICRWSQVMHYDFLKWMSIKDLHKGTNWRKSSRKLFQATFIFDWCLFNSADFRILWNDIKINFTNCLSKLLEMFPFVCQLFELNVSIEISLIQFL